MVLTLEVIPGHALGPFQLTQDVNTVIRFLHRHVTRQQRQRLKFLRQQSQNTSGHGGPRRLLSSLISAASAELGMHYGNHGDDNEDDNDHNDSSGGDDYSAASSSSSSSPPPSSSLSEGNRSSNTESSATARVLGENQFENVEILYDRRRPLNHDLVIRLCDEGITLRFEPRTQRLKRIDLNLAEHPVQLAYQLDNNGGGDGADESRNGMQGHNAVFCAPHMDPTFVRIYRIFGPTYPGVYDKKRRQYYLTYPGVTFVFPIPEQFSHIYEDDDQAMPLEFPNGTTPIAAKMFLFMGYDFQDATLPIIPSSSALDNEVDESVEQTATEGEFLDREDANANALQNIASAQNSSNYFEEVHVEVGQGIRFMRRNRPVSFGDSPQQVIMSIGRPDDIFYKRHDKLRIHAIASQQNALRRMSPPTKSSEKGSFVVNKNNQTAVDYFFNYYGLGLDIMFDGSTHKVQKIILHTNFPCSRDFNMYAKCNFRLPAFSQSATAKEKQDNKKTKKGRRLITPDMRFKDIHKILGGDATPHSRPLMNDHTQQVSPFGGTRYYAYGGTIFEVMKNDHLNSLQLFV